MSILKTSDVMLGLVLPGVITVVMLGVATRHRWLRGQQGGLVGALALLIAVYAGYFALDLGPWRPGQRGNLWIVHLPLLALPAGALLGRSWPWWFATTVLGLTGAAAAVPTVPDWWAMVVLWGAVIGYLTLFGGMPLIADEAPGLLIALVLAAVSATAMVVLMQAGLDRMARVAGVLVAVQGAAVLAAAIPGRDVRAGAIRGLVPGTLIMIAALMFNGYLFAAGAISPRAFAAVALAPIGLSVAFLPGVDRQSRSIRWGAALVVVALPLLYAITRVMGLRPGGTGL